MRRGARLVLAACVASTQLGCAMAGWNAISEGRAEGFESEIVEDAALGADRRGIRGIHVTTTLGSRLRFGELDAVVTPHNARFRVVLFGILLPLVPFTPSMLGPLTGVSYDLAAPFWITVKLDPLGRRLSFDPGAAALEDSAGVRWPVGGFAGPDCDRDHVPAPAQLRRPGAPVDFEEPACIDLVFDRVALDPREPFVLRLDGVLREGEPLRLPPIRFEQSSSWDFVFLGQD